MLIAHWINKNLGIQPPTELKTSAAAYWAPTKCQVPLDVLSKLSLIFQRNFQQESYYSNFSDKEIETKEVLNLTKRNCSDISHPDRPQVQIPTQDDSSYIHFLAPGWVFQGPPADPWLMSGCTGIILQGSWCWEPPSILMPPGAGCKRLLPAPAEEKALLTSNPVSQSPYSPTPYSPPLAPFRMNPTLDLQEEENQDEVGMVLWGAGYCMTIRTNAKQPSMMDLHAQAAACGMRLPAGNLASSMHSCFTRKVEVAQRNWKPCLHKNLNVDACSSFT